MITGASQTGPSLTRLSHTGPAANTARATPKPANASQIRKLSLRNTSTPNHHSWPPSRSATSPFRSTEEPECRMSVVGQTAAPAAASHGGRSLRSHPWPSLPPRPRTQDQPWWALRLREAATTADPGEPSRNLAPVQVVRPAGRSTWTGGQNPAPQGCGSTATGWRAARALGHDQRSRYVPVNSRRRPDFAGLGRTDKIGP